LSPNIRSSIKTRRKSSKSCSPQLKSYIFKEKLLIQTSVVTYIGTKLFVFISFHTYTLRGSRELYSRLIIMIVIGASWSRLYSAITFCKQGFVLPEIFYNFFIGRYFESHWGWSYLLANDLTRKVPGIFLPASCLKAYRQKGRVFAAVLFLHRICPSRN